ncbi:hypothetical protein KPH14_012793 [Odynerus spinipes]|uniref:GAG-pre-integrase domain-containing protein n=1 Tax=Odynerus spinipes TaxID=1348599 RepID=A0AAD9RFA8_9HYME|nr:hypothetical protein KPH14_012793 [Odynerus spinipes]
MSPNIDWMEDVTECNVPIKIAEKSRQVTSKAKGNITMEVMSREGVKKVNVKGALYVPELRANLLSVSCLNENGLTVIFEKGGAQVIGRRNAIVAEAIEEDGVFVISARPLPRNSSLMVREVKDAEGSKEAISPEEGIVERKRHESSESKKMLWHRRLGHICEGYLDTMKEKGVVRNLDFPGERLEFCEPCALGKLTQRAHVKGSVLLENSGYNEELEELKNIETQDQGAIGDEEYLIPVNKVGDECEETEDRHQQMQEVQKIAEENVMRQENNQTTGEGSTPVRRTREQRYIDHKLNLLEQEEKLRASGVRRSERINN